MRSITTDDPKLSLALQLRAEALGFIARKEPWKARRIFDSALLFVEEAKPSPERDEIEIIIKADTGTAIFGAPVFINAFLEAGPHRIFALTLEKARQTQTIGDRHPAYAYVLAREADMYLARCEFMTAERLYLQVLDIIDHSSCPDPELLAQVLESSATLMSRTDRESGARLNRARAEEIRASLRAR